MNEVILFSETVEMFVNWTDWIAAVLESTTQIQMIPSKRISS